MRINVNKIKSRITFEFKTEYLDRILTPETMKLFGRTEKR